MDRGAWSVAVHGVTKSWTQLSNRIELNWISENSKNIYLTFSVLFSIFMLDHVLSLFLTLCRWFTKGQSQQEIFFYRISWCLHMIISVWLVKYLICNQYWKIPLYAFLFNLLPMCLHAKLLQLCLTLFDTTDSSLPGSFVHRILQVRVLEWVAMSPSRWSSRPRDQTCVFYVSCFGRWVHYH